MQSIMMRPAKQKGIALLILVIIIALAFISYFMSGLSITELKVDREVKTLQALNKARQALIAYAVSYSEITGINRGPGYFPCADQDNDGVGTPVGCPTASVVDVGRFPWVTLGVGDLRDGANETLWYAVSNNFDYTTANYKVNTATTGNLTVRDSGNNIIYDGTTIDAAVAVIIAPGEALIRDDAVIQVRGTVAEKNDPVNYLDIDTASGEDNASFQHGVLGGAIQDGFIQGEIMNGGATIVNDKFTVITYGDIMEQVHKRVSREVGNVINSYFGLCGAYPEAAAFNSAVAPNSVPGQKQGFLPVGTSEPFNWGIAYAPPCDLSTIRIPVWFTNESWQLHTYYEYAYTNPVVMPPSAGVACTPGPVGDCLKANGLENIAALIVFAGRDTTGNRTASTTLSDYFEVENDDSDLVVDINGLIYDATQADDYVYVIAP